MCRILLLLTIVRAAAGAACRAQGVLIVADDHVLSSERTLSNAVEYSK